MGVDEWNSCSAYVWSREQDKKFEKAVATYPEDTCDRWEKIAGQVPGKSVEEVKYHYQVLVDDVKRIESGFVEVPCYNSCSDADDETGCGGGGGNRTRARGDSTTSRAAADQERRKGIAWTEDEHRLFLLGLEKYGKGDWRSISRNFVVTRTPTQVASHAQKYFIRLNSMNKDRRRSSIHDITSVNSEDVSVPITGQANGSAKSSKASVGGNIYAAPPTIGQPIGGPHVSAVGTPVGLLPAAYGVGVRYPMPAHR